MVGRGPWRYSIDWGDGTLAPWSVKRPATDRVPPTTRVVEDVARKATTGVAFRMVAVVVAVVRAPQR